MACDLTDPGNPAEPLYVARLGPAADYVLLQDAGFNPLAEHKVSGKVEKTARGGGDVAGLLACLHNLLPDK